MSPAILIVHRGEDGMVLDFATRTGVAADSANSPAEAIDYQIFAREGMPSKAMGFPSVHRRATKPTVGVHPGRDRFEMRWVHARSDAAKMIELQPVRDLPDQQLIRIPMGVPIALVSTELSVAHSPGASRPQPARRSLVDFEPKPLRWWQLMDRRGQRSSRFKANIVRLAQAFTVRLRGAFHYRARTMCRHLGLILRGVVRQGVSAPLPPYIVQQELP